MGIVKCGDEEDRELLLSYVVWPTESTDVKSQIEQSIAVNVPVSTAFNQWTQFEDFPRFMEDITEVRQLDDTHPALGSGDRRQDS